MAGQACEDRGHRYMRSGRHVRYNRADIEAYEQERLVTPADKIDGSNG